MVEYVPMINNNANANGSGAIMRALRSSKALTIFFIYLGTLFYVTASYFHLSIRNWTFLTAFLIALPLVCIEYQFSLRGNRAAVDSHAMNPIQVLIVTLCFYFVNLWLLNYFVLSRSWASQQISTANKKTMSNSSTSKSNNSGIVFWREAISFILVLAAFVISTNISGQ
jgi:hypothetical protein